MEFEYQKEWFLKTGRGSFIIIEVINDKIMIKELFQKGTPPKKKLVY